jgi:hypothetical protein
MTVELKELEKVSATEAARKALAAIQQENKEGLLRAEDVVDTARHPDHPLHRYFDWDDSTAAEQWRLMQARQLIRKVIVVGPVDDGKTQIPKYVSLQSDRKKPGGGYRQTNEVINSKELLSELEETAKRDIDGVLSRYNMLKDLCEKVRKAAGIEPKRKR